MVDMKLTAHPTTQTYTHHFCKDPRENCTFNFQTPNCIRTALPRSSPLSLFPWCCPELSRDYYMVLCTSAGPFSFTPSLVLYAILTLTPLLFCPLLTVCIHSLFCPFFHIYQSNPSHPFLSIFCRSYI